MLLETLKEKRQVILDLCREYGADNVRVFGSVARGEELSSSDVDLLVDFPHGYSLFKQRLPLQRKLQSVIGANLDLIPEHELNQHISATVKQEAVKL